MTIKPSDNIIILKNIGPMRAKHFYEIGITTVEDLVYFFPKNYKYMEVTINIKDIKPQTVVCVVGVVSNCTTSFNGKLSITTIKITDITGSITCVFNNRPYLKNFFKPSTPYMIMGKVVIYNNKLIISNPKYEKESDVKDKILPVYKFEKVLQNKGDIESNRKLHPSQKVIRQIIRYIIFNITIEEKLNITLRESLGLLSINTAIKEIHFPTSVKNQEMARQYFATEEILKLQQRLLNLRKSIKNQTSIKVQNICINDILNSLPFKLTESQLNVIKEIINDIKSSNVMYRLLQGDVGSGKTVIAIITSYILVKNGYQVAVMVPTSILATQHYNSFLELLKSFCICVQLLTSSVKNKDEVLDYVKYGKANVVVCTHAAIYESVVFNNLGLVITDEQHRFGVRQRMALQKKGDNPHVLVMSATPIPRSLALTIYGDLDISTINELPHGRQPISTYYVNTSYRKRVWDFIEKEAINGKASYIVCPAIDSNDITSVYDYEKKILNYYKSKNSPITESIAILHGGMSEEEKEIVMNNLNIGKISVLISTTVVEVGVNIKHATIMVIEEAHRFGISQLHQLRGRIGRWSYKSYCILISDTDNCLSLSRLQAMVNNSDGFKLSNLDLKLRGPGDFFGTAQHGIINFKLANLQKDLNIISEVQRFVRGEFGLP